MLPVLISTSAATMNGPQMFVTSDEAVLPQLELFTIEPTQTAIHSTEVVQHRPVNPIVKDAPIQFVIQSDDYIDLSSLNLCVKVSVKKESDNKDVTGTDLTGIGFINNTLHSMFHHVEVTMQNKQVFYCSNYPYLAYMYNILNRGEVTHEGGTGFLEVFYPDKECKRVTSMEATTTTGAYTNEEGKARADYMSDTSRTLCGPLLVDVFRQKKYLLPGIKMQITLSTTNKAFQFYANNDAQKNYYLGIEDCVITTKQLKVIPIISLNHQRSLEHKPAMYPYKQTEVTTHLINSGGNSFVRDNIFLGRRPSRFMCGLIKNNSFVGDHSNNPLSFELHKIGRIHVSSGDRSITYNLNTTNSEFTQPLEALAKTSKFPFTYNGFGNGYGLFLFELEEETKNTLGLQKEAITNLEINFASNLDTTVVLVIYAEYPALLSVDKYRNIEIQ